MTAVYCRVSTARQADRETIQVQVDYARKYLDLHGITAEFYIDDGITGTIPLSDRPAGKRLMSAAEAGTVKTLYVYKIDRLGRSTRVILNAIHQLEEYGVAVKSMTEPFDTSTPAGRFMLTMLAGVADLERSNILERMNLGRDKAIAQNKYVYGLPPYGYRLDDESRLILDPAESKTVRKIFDMYLSGTQSTHSIAEYLQASAIPLPQKALSNHHGWRPGTVSKILHNTVYAGKYKIKTGIISTPAIITQDEYDRVQQMVKDNLKFSTRNAHRTYILRSLIRCSKCGYAYVGGSSSSGFYYYRCTNRNYYKRYNMPKCMNANLRAGEVESAVWTDVVNHITDISNGVKEVSETEPDNPEPALTAQLKKCDVERERMLDLYRTGVLQLTDIRTQLDKIEKHKKRLQAEINSLQKPTPVPDMDAVAQILEVLSTALTDEIKAEVCRTVIDRIVVNDGDYKIFYKV